MPKVFISYSHDSDDHRQQVLELADRLNNSENDVDCEIDQYINGSPPEGWPLWMERMLEDSTYVLVICTETYLNRVKRQEKPGTGKGVKWESLLTYQDIYDNDSLNRKFVPVIFKVTDAAFIPKPLRAFTHYDLSHSGNYEMMCRYLTGQPLVVKPNPKSKLHLPPSNIQTASTPIYSDRLPNVIGEFFGREAELKLLDEAWAGNGTNIIQFIAPGGTGKTKLLRHWLDHTDNIEALIAWSFYSQGSSEDKQVSASPFFSHVFDKLGLTRSLSSFATEEDKGEHLADLLRQQRCVLVLDGLEPLQHAGKGMRNELKDRAMRRLLMSLAGYNNGLCIITTRVAVHELNNRTHVKVHDLQNLAVADGVKLLQSLGVQGNGKELEKAVREYGCHALALHLLGNALHTYLDNDVRKRDTLTELIGDNDDLERHAFKVMQAYSHWLNGTPELKLLQLLGLFDHPIEIEVLQVLWQSQIPDLTTNINEKAWKVAIRDLREKHRLLSMHENRADLLDCHPLIRVYFGKQLREKQPDAWRQAHTRLYEYYKALPEKEFPDTLEEMQPLFSAVAHGYAAGLHQNTLEEIHWLRINRRNDNFVCTRLGAFSDDLAAMAHYFTIPWHTPTTDIAVFWQAAVLNWVGFNLRALGRLHEALEPLQVSVDMAVKQEDWNSAANGAFSLSNLHLTLGNIAAAILDSQRSINFADQSKNYFYRISRRAACAYILHQAGQAVLALELFKKAEQLQRELQPEYPHLYSLWGFYYCDLLLAQNKMVEVLERAQYALELSQHPDAKDGMGLLDIALDQLSLGRANFQQGNFPQAAFWLDCTVVGLRKAGQQDVYPLAYSLAPPYIAMPATPITISPEPVRICRKCTISPNRAACGCI
ncbi:TIR domain-containing protein [Nitrosomonas sp. Is35]|uniref:SEFIR domain-containing protein n=1 Tax=Nitrosomonas sp. Is35 TaxID=3080534 RepID=UPI00294B706D|nr:SEFIR domain-containing protein [Nitrosomonas sp. Is35]MDV6345997.1 TIR domain-containing protein [Nitrosomonas sp. Is35]